MTERVVDVEVDCFCKGRNQRCNYCEGSGKRLMRGCRRCRATGKEGTKNCPDCRGQKWRDLDNMDLTI